MSYKMPGVTPIGIPKPPQPKPKVKKKKPAPKQEQVTISSNLSNVNKQIVAKDILDAETTGVAAVTEAIDNKEKDTEATEIQESLEATKETVEEMQAVETTFQESINIISGVGSVTQSDDPGGTLAPSFDDFGADPVGTGQSAAIAAVDASISQEDTTAIQTIQDVEFAKDTLAELKVDRIKRQATLLPPLPPNSEFFTIDKEIDRLFIILSPSTGRIRKKFPPSLFLKDWEMVRQQLSKEKFQEFGDFSTPNEMLFSGIERPAAYEVLKLNEKPTKISDFLRAQKILVDPDLGIYEDHNIKANHKYYYAFRSIEKDNTLTEEINDGLISYISDPIEVELVNEGNISFLTTKPLLLNEEEKKHYVKTFRRRIRIQPSLLQTIPVKTERDIGNLNDSSFDPKNKFKVRLTSSKTGRKIDLNIKFVKNKLKQALPPEGAKRLIDLTKPKTIPTDTGPVEKEEKTFDIDGTIKVSVDGKEYDITNAKTDIPGVAGKIPALNTLCKEINPKNFPGFSVGDDSKYNATKFFCDKYIAEDCDNSCKSKYTAFLTNMFFLIPKRKYIICTYEKSPGKCYYEEK